jgi:3-oxoacyl-[acyl-carrier-protein] synthase III
MKILAVAHALPSTLLDHNWILAKLDRENTTTLTAADRARLLEKADAFLKGAGSETRYQSQSSDERPIDLALDASRNVLATSGVRTDEIDFVIYAGVGRGWLEPATAHVLQAGLDLERATCFDVLDGCASWLRALHIARNFVRSGEHRRGLIVNCECGFRGHGRWQFDSVEQFDAYTATYTIGEAATATLVGTDGRADDFHFNFRSLGRAYDLCMIPNASDFMTGPSSELQDTTKFYSQSTKLMTLAIEEIADLFRSDPVFRKQEYDITLGHEASEKATAAVIRILRLPPERHFAIHREYGNAVAASVPLAMSLAQDQGRLHRGDRVLIVVAASGITVGMASFTY